MPTADIISAQKLSGEAFGKLRDAIGQAFGMPHDLEMHVKIAMGIKLYKEVTNDREKLDYQIYQLLEFVESRGLTTKLLRSILEKRSGAPVCDTIRKYWPQALEETPSSADDVRVVAASIEKTAARPDPAARSVVIASREKLDKLKSDIDDLFNYKVLHDCLHKIQLRHYPIIAEKVKQFRSDPLAAAELAGEIILEVTDVCSDARKAAESLPEMAALQAQETRWVARLESATTELEKAANDLDKYHAVHAVRLFERVIRDEPARINGYLTDIANKLPLKELKKVITSDALNSLQAIGPRLKGRVAEHKEWQEIEPDFWAAKDCLERKSPESIEEFTGLWWPNIKSRVLSLARVDPNAKWVKATEVQAALIERALAGRLDSPMAESQNVEDVGQYFEAFRETALYHFFQVNRDLKNLFQQILKLRDPLGALLKGVPYAD
ncbi:hypothetical protein [Methylosinus sp. KRF6]|uniref:hypothetical protein n=1 Tax=Methylosinus sp. KRF6 TaxID=2846853 RepID=UPI001C0D78B1|nr:hypothetical protein [Methylosinus sp. KRF6]MBU3890359.1 hypothetical protein [Methylosinus sp. KRF6]